MSSSDKEKNAGKERRIFLICCMLWFFLSGVEYAIVLPSIHDYLNSIGAETNYMGLVISALSFGAMISAPIYGKLTDRLQKAVYTLRFGMLFSICGSLMYFLFPTKNMIVLPRFIGGIGWGLEGALMGQIGRTFNQESKTAKFASVLMMRQFGVVLGPSCILFLHKFAFTATIGDWTIEVTKYSASGVLLTVAWTAAWLFMLAFYVDPPAEPEKESIIQTSVTDSLLQISDAPTVDKKYRYTKKMGLLHEPIIVASCCTFSTYILQSGMEALVTPFTDWYLGWDMTQNAIIYMVVGTIAFTGYISMQFVSKKFDDRVTLLAGCISLTAVLLTVIVVYPILEFQAIWLYPVFGSCLLVFCWFLPYVVVSAAAVLSKSASNDLQSTVQAVRTTGEVLAQCASPPWVASMMVISQEFTLVFQLAFMAICSIMVLLSWQVLKPEESIPYSEKSQNIVQNGEIELENGLDTDIDKNLTKRLIEDVGLSHHSLPSSVMCSFASVKQ